MATVRWHEEGTVWKGQTDRVLEFVFLDTDGTVRDLTGWCGYVTFWYAGSLPHVTRAGSVDPNGIIRYFPQGDEFPTVGDVLFQATLLRVDATAGVDRAWQTESHEVIRRRVVEAPA